MPYRVRRGRVPRASRFPLDNPLLEGRGRIGLGSYRVKGIVVDPNGIGHHFLDYGGAGADCHELYGTARFLGLVSVSGPDGVF